MENEAFLSELQKYQGFFDPAMYDSLVANAAVLPVDTKQALIDKVHEAAQEMQELFSYQKTRESICKEGLQKLEGMFDEAKAKFKEIIQQKEASESGKEKAEAESLLNNM